MYYVYMLRCMDNSIYTGMTNDLTRRMEEHFSKDKKCAKYTMSHNAKKMEIAWQTEERSDAAKLEFHIKSLLKKDKEMIIKNPEEIGRFLSTKIDIERYSIFER